MIWILQLAFFIAYQWYDLILFDCMKKSKIMIRIILSFRNRRKNPCINSKAFNFFSKFYSKMINNFIFGVKNLLLWDFWELGIPAIILQLIQSQKIPTSRLTARDNCLALCYWVFECLKARWNCLCKICHCIFMFIKRMTICNGVIIPLSKFTTFSGRDWRNVAF